MSNDISLKLTIRASADELSRAMSDGGRAVERFGQVATSNFSRTRQGLESISAQLQQARNQFLTFVGVTSLGDAAANVVRLADDFTSLIIDSVQKALVVGGSTAQGAAAAILQLTQALSSGVLRGDEFNAGHTGGTGRLGRG